MKSTVRIVFACAALVITTSGCKRPPAEKAEHKDEHAHDEESKGHSDEKHGDERGHKPVGQATPGVLRVDPEMVRDLRVTTAPVESRAGGEVVSVLGELQVNQDAYAEVGTPVVGRVNRVLKAAGDKVTIGAALAEIESAELGKARAAEVSARARAELANQTAARKRQLVSERIAAARELQEAEAEAKAAEADLRAARTTLSAFGAAGAPGAGARFTLRSPIAGTILDRKIARGQVVDPEEMLFQIGDLGSLWLTVHAFERDALRVKPGMAARVSFPALPGRSFAGKVIWVGSQVEVSSRTIPVRVSVANQDGLLRPGMSGSAWLPVGEAGGTLLAVPMAALQRLERDWVAFVPTKERSTFEIRTIGRGRDLGGEVEVISGLKSGERVVVDGAFLLKAEAEKARGMGEHHEH
jgi:membrane fusion protein, heavy metal efflux system